MTNKEKTVSKSDFSEIGNRLAAYAPQVFEECFDNDEYDNRSGEFDNNSSDENSDDVQNDLIHWYIDLILSPPFSEE